MCVWGSAAVYGEIGHDKYVFKIWIANEKSFVVAYKWLLWFLLWLKLLKFYFHYIN